MCGTFLTYQSDSSELRSGRSNQGERVGSDGLRGLIPKPFIESHNYVSV